MAAPAQEGMMPELVPRLPFAEESLLLDEFNHRINNEFASLIAIVARAAAASANDEAKRALGGVAQLLHHSAQVHQALRRPYQEVPIDAEGYLDNLCRSISRSKLDHMKIDLALAAVPLWLDADCCWRLGMIVSELITNAARHAFGGRPGKIRVELMRTGRSIKCAVCDNGSAPAQIRPGRGLTIIEELTRTLDGRFERKVAPAGTAAILIFPYREPEEATRGRDMPAAGDEAPRNLRTDRAATSAANPKFAS
jgi:two-component sensor histidine kinase